MPPTLIPKFLRRFLRLFPKSLATPHKSCVEAITSSFPIESYCSVICYEYILQGMARMTQVIVTRAWVLKEKERSQHESLVIEARDLGGHGEVFYLRFERGRCVEVHEKATEDKDISTPPSSNPDGLSSLSTSPSLASLSAKSEPKWRPSPIASAPTASLSSKSSHSTDSSSITSSEPCLAPSRANDTVGPLAATTHSEEVIVFSLRFLSPSATTPLSSSSSSNPALSATIPSSPSTVLTTILPLYHLAILSLSVHKLNPTVLDGNCHHFLGSILHVLMGTYAHLRSDETIPGHSFKWKGKTSGNWGPFSISKSNQFDPGLLRAKFAEEKKIFESKVLKEEAKRKAERDQLENAQMKISLLSERLENAERETARLRAQVNVKG